MMMVNEPNPGSVPVARPRQPCRQRASAEIRKPTVEAIRGWGDPSDLPRLFRAPLPITTGLPHLAQLARDQGQSLAGGYRGGRSCGRSWLAQLPLLRAFICGVF